VEKMTIYRTLKPMQQCGLERAVKKKPSRLYSFMDHLNPSLKMTGMSSIAQIKKKNSTLGENNY